MMERRVSGEATRSTHKAEGAQEFSLTSYFERVEVFEVEIHF